MEKKFEKPQAIVYTSMSGHTEQYAEIISDAVGIPAIPSEKGCAPGTPILYMGWIMAGKVSGYKKAASRYKICAVCGVGMSENSSQVESIRKSDCVPEEIPVFSIQGGLDISRLRGIYKMMIKAVASSVKKDLKKNEALSEEEKKTLKMFTDGESYVCAENAREIIDLIRR